MRKKRKASAPGAQAQKKSKRLARDFDRDFALELVRLYRTQERQRFVVNGRELEGHRVTGDTLAYELERFALLGTWETSTQLGRASPTVVAKYDPTKVSMRNAFNKLRADGVMRDHAIAKVMQDYGVSEQSVLDTLYSRRRKKKPSR